MKQVKDKTKQKNTKKQKNRNQVRKQATNELSWSSGPANHDTAWASCTGSPDRKCTGGCWLTGSPSRLEWKQQHHSAELERKEVWLLCYYTSLDF